MRTGPETGHLSAEQRTRIRNSLRTPVALARTYGVSVALIRRIQDSSVKTHPARLAKFARRAARLRARFD